MTDIQDAISTEASTTRRQTRLALNNARAAQSVTLFAIVKAAQDTAFGRRNYFPSIDSVSRFSELVPAGSAHTHRSMMELQKATGASILFRAEAGDHTSVDPRNGQCSGFPVAAVDQANRRQAAEAAFQTIHRETGFLTGSYADLSDLKDHSEIPATGLHTNGRIDLAGLKTASDPEVRNYVALLMIAAAGNLTGLITSDIRQLGDLQKLLDRDGPVLLEDLADGQARVSDRFPGGLPKSLRRRIIISSDRLAGLRETLQTKGSLQLADLMPRLRAVAVADGAGRTTDLDAILPPRVRIADLGCWRPEGLLTLPSPDGEEGCIPNLLNIFFEFEAPGTAGILGLEDLTTGRDYSVRITTASGLYRYRLDLTARVTGWAGNCPRLIFTGDESINGSERVMPSRAALGAVQKAMNELCAPHPFVRLKERIERGYSLIANAATVDAVTPELLQRSVEKRLQAVSYRYARLRELGCIPAVEIVRSPAARATAPAREQEEDCTAA